MKTLVLTSTRAQPFLGQAGGWILHKIFERLDYQVFVKATEGELLHRIQSVFHCWEKLTDIGHFFRKHQRKPKWFKIHTSL